MSFRTIEAGKVGGIGHEDPDLPVFGSGDSIPLPAGKTYLAHSFFPEELSRPDERGSLKVTFRFIDQDPERWEAIVIAANRRLVPDHEDFKPGQNIVVPKYTDLIDEGLRKFPEVVPEKKSNGGYYLKGIKPRN